MPAAVIWSPTNWLSEPMDGIKELDNSLHPPKHPIWVAHWLTTLTPCLSNPCLSLYPTAVWSQGFCSGNLGRTWVWFRVQKERWINEQRREVVSRSCVNVVWLPLWPVHHSTPPHPSLLLPLGKGKEKEYHQGTEHKEDNADKASGDLTWSIMRTQLLLGLLGCSLVRAFTQIKLAVKLWESKVEMHG